MIWPYTPSGTGATSLADLVPPATDRAEFKEPAGFTNGTLRSHLDDTRRQYAPLREELEDLYGWTERYSDTFLSGRYIETDDGRQYVTGSEYFLHLESRVAELEKYIGLQETMLAIMEKPQQTPTDHFDLGALVEKLNHFDFSKESPAPEIDVGAL